MKTVRTYYARIYLGFRKSYGDYNSNDPFKDLNQIIKEYITEDNPMCVNVSRTNYIYVDGEEEGACVELINYPRFPSSEAEIQTKAIKLAKVLKRIFVQNRVSIVCPDETIMIGNEND